MERRQFLKTSAFASTSLTTGALFSPAARAAHHKLPKFKLHYAPHPRMFKASAGDNIIDQIKFASDQGFTAWEYNGLPNETPSMQSRIGKTLDDLNMKMGVFIAYSNFDQPTFTRPDPDSTEEILRRMQTAVNIARRVNAKWATVVPGSVDQQYNGQETWNRYGGPRLSEGYQTANAIDMLRRCTDVLEPHGMTIVLEPLNWHANHGGVFLQYSEQAYAICRAVNSPSCKILFDIYHQQITEGNLIPNIDHCWSEIGYFQSGDNPGRKEPGTGEINYRNVFKRIHDKAKKDGREFIIGMEHGNSLPGKEGEQVVIDAYRQADSF